jgi:hypothetical protein
MNRRLPEGQISSTRRARLKLLVAATSIVAVTQLVACGTNPGEASSQIAVTGTLLHEEQVGTRSMGFGIDDDGYDQFRAAADFYVGRDNKLLLYSHAHHANTDVFGCPDSKLKLSEFAY